MGVDRGQPQVPGGVGLLRGDVPVLQRPGDLDDQRPHRIVVIAGHEPDEEVGNVLVAAPCIVYGIVNPSRSFFT